MWAPFGILIPPMVILLSHNRLFLRVTRNEDCDATKLINSVISYTVLHKQVTYSKRVNIFMVPLQGIVHTRSDFYGRKHFFIRVWVNFKVVK